MAEIVLDGTSRSEFGKGAARRLRAAGQIPAVIYGHGTDPVHLSLPSHATQLALRQANALLSITIDGEKAQLALPKQVQRDPIKGFVEHVDLLIVNAGERVHVEVPIILVGELRDGIAVVDLNTVTVSAPATNIPSEIEVNLENLDSSSQVTMGELVLPAGVEIVGDPDTLVLSVAQAPSAAAFAASLESADGAADEADSE